MTSVRRSTPRLPIRPSRCSWTLPSRMFRRNCLRNRGASTSTRPALTPALAAPHHRHTSSASPSPMAWATRWCGCTSRNFFADTTHRRHSRCGPLPSKWMAQQASGTSAGRRISTPHRRGRTSPRASITASALRFTPILLGISHISVAQGTVDEYQETFLNLWLAVRTWPRISKSCFSRRDYSYRSASTLNFTIVPLWKTP
jgi:hypothetical protein